jgi:NADH dehydrogenase
MSKLVILGGGFAGVWAALAASARRGKNPWMDITLVSRDPWLTIRPRLYEDDIGETRVPLDEVLAPVGVGRVEGEVARINAEARTLVMTDGAIIRYDRLILAAGSVVQRAAIPGATSAFSVDTYREALALHEHLVALPGLRAEAAGRYTAVVVGAGFTGIEVATALASRMRRIAAGAGARERARILVVERAPLPAPDLSDSARRHVVEAFKDLQVEWRSGVSVEGIEGGGVRLSGGEWVEAATVVLTGGFRASALAAQLAVPHDALGRVSVDACLRVRGVENVFAAGDVASAVGDKSGHILPMSCQCAIPMGEVAGANAAAELLGAEPAPLSYPEYVTCLDLGDSGALFMQGWDREVRLNGFWGKLVKEAINTRLIYPPRPGQPSRHLRDARSAA